MVVQQQVLESSLALWTKLHKIINSDFLSLYKFKGIQAFRTVFDGFSRFRVQISGNSMILSKSLPLREAVTSSLLIRLGCPDTQKLSTHLNSFESGLYCLPAIRKSIVIFDGNKWFSRIQHSPPQLYQIIICYFNENEL